ncbi:hypothetical protein BHE74_00037146 [Ensete ventricosum]|nr:hypothetical protein BHE74_00037146 [Ensete ventricosum]
MALDDAINAKLEAIEARIEDKLRALFKEFRSGRSRSPKRSQLEESSNHKENPAEKGDQALDPLCPRTRVDFPRWEDGDPIGWISLAEWYFLYHKTQDAFLVDIAVIYLEGDAIQFPNSGIRAKVFAAKAMRKGGGRPWPGPMQGRLLATRPVAVPVRPPRAAAPATGATARGQDGLQRCAALLLRRSSDDDQLGGGKRV